jgi:formate dehydrogenase maturation protein FdhE
MSGCPNCASTDLVSVDMALRGGSVRFAHCRRCEHRWWFDAERGTFVPLADVLALA